VIGVKLNSAHVRKHGELALALGWQDLKQAYRRSAIGPFWITAGMGVQIATMGIVFGLIFKTNTTDYVPFLAVSIIIWGFISSTISDSCLAFISAESIIKQVDIPFTVHVIRVLWKNALNLIHNLAILPVVFLIFGRGIDGNVLLAFPGLVLLAVNLAWMGLILAMLSARFRDMPPIVSSLLTITFYLTPIMWFPELLPGGTAHLLLGLNPFYHLLQIVRLPILGESPTIENWLLSFSFAIFGSAASAAIFRRFKSQIAYWV
jgi:lipopolysaccharide transport system permease protein